MTTTATEAVESCEVDNIRAWKLDRFLELGYKIADAQELVDRNADWHLVADLIRKGCSKAKARRIAS
jgi:hypothetical protein